MNKKDLDLKTISKLPLAEKAQILLDTEGNPSSVLLSLEDFRFLATVKTWNTLRQISPSEWETAEILSDPLQAETIFKSLKEAQEGKTLPIESLLKK